MGILVKVTGNLTPYFTPHPGLKSITAIEKVGAPPANVTVTVTAKPTGDFTKPEITNLKPESGEYTGLVTRPTISDLASPSNISTIEWNFYVGESKFNLYFGGLHSHTNLSDGTGTPDDAYAWARNNTKADYLAITDHSNWLDGEKDLKNETITEDGKYELIVIAVDLVGNSSKETINFTVTATLKTTIELMAKFYNQGLFKNEGIYNSLNTKLSKENLTAFTNELSAQTGKGIDEYTSNVLMEYVNWISSKEEFQDTVNNKIAKCYSY